MESQYERFGFGGGKRYRLMLDAMRAAERGEKPTIYPSLLPLPLEHAEQNTVFKMIERYAAKFPKLSLLYANPNQTIGESDRRYKASEGLRPGIPDLFLPVSASGYPGFYIEMKRGDWFKDSYPSTEQRLWLDALRQEGYRVEVAPGALVAWEMLTQYVEGLRTASVGMIDDTSAERVARQRGVIREAAKMGITLDQYKTYTKALNQAAKQKAG